MNKNLKLNISDDKLKCHLIIEKAESDELSYSMNDIKELLSEEKIISGINEGTLEKIVDTQNSGEFLIAEGSVSQDGLDGTITYLIKDLDKNSKIQYILEGDKLVDIKAATKATEGVNIFGSKSNGIDGKDFDITRIIGIGLEYDEENSCLISETNGEYSKNADGTISIIKKNIVNLEINTDKSQCILIIDEFSKNRFTEIELNNALKKEKITIGIKKEILKKLTETKNFDSDKIVIAESIPPIKGADGHIEYLIDDNSEIKYEENENADFYNIEALTNVSENDMLAKVHLPKDGVDGQNIFGDKIEAKKGEEFNSKQILGVGVKLIEDENSIKSTTNGIYEKNAVGLISVVDEYKISNDVDFEIGSIDTTSALEIGGDIKSGFKVKSESNISVNGVIEDAEVISGNNIICKLGILNGVLEISAKALIKAKYINERECEASNIYVKSGITNSVLKVTDTIEADKIIGGKLFAKEKIEVNELGSSQFIETIIIMGQNYKISNKIEENRKKLSKLSKELKLSEIKLYRDKKDYNVISTKINSFANSGSTNKNLLNSLAMQSKDLQKKIELRRNKIKNSFELKIKSLENLNSKLNEKLNEDSSPEINVKKTVYPNVKIRMKNSLVYEVKNEVNNVRFELNDDDSEVVMMQN